jgi:hypothetical protein
LKAKRKASSIKNKPNPISHMMVWGFGSGFILADLYLVLLADFSYSLNVSATIIALISPITLMLSFFFGGVVGLGLGGIEGEVMRRILIARTRHKVNASHSRGTALQVYILCFVLSFLGFSHFLVAGISPERVGLLFVPLIASSASVYAAHRYLLHLRQWNAQHPPEFTNVEKEKRYSHLEDRPKHDIVCLPDEEESKIHETS